MSFPPVTFIALRSKGSPVSARAIIPSGRTTTILSKASIASRTSWELMLPRVLALLSRCMATSARGYLSTLGETRSRFNISVARSALTP